jgi:predicted PurR-regulated permease PerM
MSVDYRSCLGENRLLFLVMIAALILISYLVFPLLDGMILGVVFAYVGLPVRNLFGKRRLLGSAIATFCIAIPISMIVGIGAIEVVNQFIWMAEHQGEILKAASFLITDLHIPQVVMEELNVSIKNVVSIAASIASSIPVFGLGKAFSLGVLNFILSLPVCYFLLADGHKLGGFLMSILPPEKAEINEKYLTKIDRMLSGIILGSVYTAITGGLVSIIIFFMFGVPRPYALASMVFLAGLIPFMTWLVFIPASIYRYFTLGPFDALVFFAVGSVLVHVAELVIRPYFVYTKSSLHPLLVMISFMGGGLVAGIAGFFLAPALVGMLVAIYQVNQEELAKQVAEEDNDALP